MTTMQGPLTSEKVNRLLTPISDEQPAGTFLKGNRSVYRPLRNAYNIAQTSLNKLALNPDPEELDDLLFANKENWQQLENQLLDCLEKQSKDIECIAWLGMAQMFDEQPYQQLALVINLLDLSLKAFWPNIQPLLPEDKLKSDNPDYERTKHHLQALQRLLGDSEDSCPLVTPMCMRPLIGGIDYSRYQREKTCTAELKQTVSASFSTEKNHVLELINGMLATTDALDQLDQTLAAKFADTGLQPPGSQFLRKQISGNLAVIKILSDGLITPWPPDIHAQSLQSSELIQTADLENPAATESPAEENSQDHSAQNPLMLTGDSHFTRDQAFHQIRLLADFFQRTEPQSPVPYILEKAIRWGYTPLPKLMNELLQGNDSLMSRITELTGMNLENRITIPGQPASSLDVPTAEPTTGASIGPKQSVDIPPPEEPDTPVEIPPTLETTASPPDDSDRTKKPERPPSGFSITNLDDLV